MTAKPSGTERHDIHERITKALVRQLEIGIRPWLQPWRVEHRAGAITRPLRANGAPYRGINVLMLWLSAVERGYAAPIWMTFKQAQALGGHVRQGEKGTLVTYADRMRKTEPGADGTEEEREIWFLKTYVIFNVEQIEGLPEPFHALAPTRMAPGPRLAHAEAFFKATRADIRHLGSRAFYSLPYDYIGMPPFETFRDRESYYATLGHEVIHWTRHPSRLDRRFDQKRFGDAGYAREELVAELGSAFLAADLGLELEPRDDHAAYLADWLVILKADKRAIVVAASYAQRACDYLQSLQPEAASPAG